MGDYIKVWARNHWLAIAGGVSMLWPLIHGTIRVGGDIDFVVSLLNDPGWVKTAIDFVLNPPGWALVITIFVGGSLVIWDTKRSRGGTKTKPEASDEPGRGYVSPFAGKRQSPPPIIPGRLVNAIDWQAEHINGLIWKAHESIRPRLDAASPYIEIHLDLANVSVYELTYIEFEGRLFYRDDPIDPKPDIIASEPVLKRNSRGRYALRQFINSDLRNRLISERGQIQELVPSENFRIKFSYENRYGETKEARWAGLPALFDISVPREPEKPSNPQSPPVIRDWNIQQALHWWRDNVGGLGNIDDVIFFRDIRQFARDGFIKIWGRPDCVGLTVQEYPHQPYEAIPADHWRNHDFDWMTYIFGDTEELIREAATPASNNSTLADRYADLRVTGAEIKALWPEANKRG